MAEKKYFWMKLKKDFFSSKRIKKMLKMENGAEMLVVYLKMQLKALEDDAHLYFDNVMGDFSEELALDIDADEDVVRKTIEYLMKVGLMEVSDDGTDYTLCFLKSLINCDTSNAIRQQRFRRKALQNNGEALQNNATVTDVSRDSNVTVTPMSQNRNGEKEIDIEIELDTEKETELEKERRERVDYQLIADMYNDTCVSFPRLTALSDTRKKAIKARSKDHSLGDFQKVFEKAEASSFLKGKNDRNWSATFDWMMKDANMAKILDGNYDEKKTTAKKGIDWDNL